MPVAFNAKLAEKILAEIEAADPLNAEPQAGAARLIMAGLRLSALGDEAVPVLLQAATSGSYARRWMAAYALGMTRSPEALGVLQQVFDAAGDPLLRQTAYGALASLHSEQLLPVLERGLQDPDPEIRGIAMKAINERKFPVAVGVLIEQLEDSDPDAVSSRWEAAERLVSLPEQEVPASTLLRFVNDRDPEVRKIVIQKLSEYEGPDNNAVIAAMLNALHDSEWMTVKAAATMLTRHVDIVAASLMDHIDGKGQRLRPVLADLLELTSDEFKIPGLLRLFELAGNREHKARIALKLQKIPSPAVLPALTDSVNARSGYDCKKIFSALKRHAMPESVPLLRERVLDAAGYDRDAALAALIAIKHPDSTAALLEVVNLRDKAATAPTASAAFEPVINFGDKSVAPLVVLAVAELAKRKAVEALPVLEARAAGEHDDALISALHAAAAKLRKLASKETTAVN